MEQKAGNISKTYLEKEQDMEKFRKDLVNLGAVSCIIQAMIVVLLAVMLVK